MSVVGEHVGSYCPWCQGGQRCPELIYRRRKRARALRTVAGVVLLIVAVALSVALTAPAGASVTRDAARVSATHTDTRTAQTRAQTRSASLTDALVQTRAHTATRTATRSASLSARHVASLSHWALKWAEARAGAPYVWGGTGPGYDCSGLVYMAYLHVGINLGRDTFEMLAQGGIYQISWRDRRPGDLLFWGNSHVEFATRHNSFGAQQPGTLVGWHLLWGSPTVWRIR